MRIDTVIPLADALDPASAGPKAASLAKLMRAGLPVPDGFVITEAAATTSPELAEAIAAHLEKLGGDPVAVRSSAIAEDLAEASFAGIYESVLDVRGVDELHAAIGRCRTSASSPRARAYQPGRSVLRMAILIQRMIPATASGVAFSQDPVTGEHAVVINAVPHVGAEIADNEIPEEWRVRGESCTRHGPASVLTEDQARTVTALTRRVASTLGMPHDVEWALVGDQVFLLQARPITAAPQDSVDPVPVPVSPPPGYWLREDTHLPFAASPFSRALIRLLAHGIAHSCREFGLLIEAVDIREIGGWAYYRTVPFGGKDGPAPPWWLFAVLARVIPSIRQRMGVCVRAIREDLPAWLVDRWYGQWRAEFDERIAGLRDVDLSVTTDDELSHQLDTGLELAEQGAEIHFLLNVVTAVSLVDLAATCNDVLRWGETKSFDLVAGTSQMSTEPARALADVATVAGRSKRVVELLDAGASVEEVLDADTAFAEAFRDYQRTYGCRTLRYDVSEPTLGEQPNLLLHLVRQQVSSPADARDDARSVVAAETLAAARRQVAAGNDVNTRDRFERALARALAAYPVREDNEYFTITAPWALVRLTALELGRRLTERHQIRRRDDVFALEISEARHALRDGANMHDLVQRRRGERIWVLKHPGPPSYGKDPGPPPSLVGLPREARLANEALLWQVNRTLESERSATAHQRGSRVLTGVAAAAGTLRGVVRVVRSESELNKVRAGEVMVCPVTAPAWSVVFPVLGALVTDSGGTLSHSAIIAREFGIPAVVATGNATEVLHDGQIVTVDGTAGLVHVES